MRFVDAEAQGGEVFGPERLAVGANGEAYREGRVLCEVEFGLFEGAKREARDPIELVLIGLVVDFKEHGEAIAFYCPREALIVCLDAIERRERTAGHVAKLNAVAGFFGGVDEDRELGAGLIEGVFGDVAKIKLVAGGELLE